MYVCMYINIQWIVNKKNRSKGTSNCCGDGLKMTQRQQHGFVRYMQQDITKMVYVSALNITNIENKADVRCETESAVLNKRGWK